MSRIYGNNEKCSMLGHANSALGCDLKTGECYALDNGKPYDECPEYESDYICSECQADLNTEKCTCFNGE